MDWTKAILGLICVFGGFATSCYAVAGAHHSVLLWTGVAAFLAGCALLDRAAE